MSQEYTPPLRDLRFVLNDVLSYDQIFEFPAYSHADAELADAVLNESARFNAEILGPLNSVGDQYGSRLENGRIVTPPGFRDAYQKYVDGGWPGLDMPLTSGGQQLPFTVQAACAEMGNGACQAFCMLTLMERASARLLLAHAPTDVANTYVPNLTSGTWGATICISEAQAGSDVGRITTSAIKREDGTYTITGTKIFITFADQDLTEQIAHMVLARISGAPSGTKGLSLFLVPRRSIRSDGSLGDVNAQTVVRVEHKMGLRASPTCVLSFDGATGYLLGSENGGLKALFTMVNAMRLDVAVCGVGVASAATVKALRYASERPQGGSPQCDPINIIEHADVRRMLYTMRARTEALRAVVLEAALNLDIAREGPLEQRNDALALAEWLLPVCKACCSEAAFEVSNLAVQVHGGHGYVSDAGVEQYVRDSRVMSIYEGANGIQALDLVTRKLAPDDGWRYRLFINRVRTDLAIARDRVDLTEIHNAMSDAVARLDNCTEEMLARLQSARRDAEASASAYLALVGLVAGGWMWLRMASVATDDSSFHKEKRELARFYAQYLIPDALALEQRARFQARYLDSLDNDALIRPSFV